MRIAYVLIIGLVLLVATACGDGSRASTAGSDLDAVRERGMVRVGVKADTRPFGYRVGGQLTGFDIDIANAVARQLGIEAVELVPVTSADRIAKLSGGAVDLVVASMTATRGRDREVDFSLPYFQDGQGLLVQADSALTSYLDLDGRLIGAVKGSTSAATIATVAPGATVVEFGDYTRLERALNAGTVDAITTDTLILVGMAKASGGALRLAGSAFTVEPYAIAVRENQSDWRDAINEALQALWESGQYQLIYQTWFGPGTPYADHVGFTMTTYPR
jgi:polar amino acid transport system substrate-binding protein